LDRDEITKVSLVPLQPDIEIMLERNYKELGNLDTRGHNLISVLHINLDSVRMSAFRTMPSKPVSSDDIPLNPHEEIWTMEGLTCGVLYNFPDE
jgi:hypothetical protein